MRTLTAALRNKLESVNNEDAIVVFVTIYYGNQQEPIRLNTDVVDYVYNDETYYGAALTLSFISDTDKPTRAEIAVPNVDRAIGEWILSLTQPPRIDMEILLKSDFSDTNPRAPIGIPEPEIAARYLYLRNVKCNAVQLTAEIQGFDLSSEPWPSARTTPAIAPALFR